MISQITKDEHVRYNNKRHVVQFKRNVKSAIDTVSVENARQDQTESVESG